MNRAAQKEITSYRHPPASSEQEPDTRPGPYYISAVDGPKAALVSGPYATHAEALALVAKASAVAIERDPRAHFAAFGTVRMREGFNSPGALQRWGYDLQIEKEQDDNDTTT